MNRFDLTHYRKVGGSIASAWISGATQHSGQLRAAPLVIMPVGRATEDETTLVDGNRDDTSSPTWVRPPAHVGFPVSA